MPHAKLHGGPYVWHKRPPASLQARCLIAARTWSYHASTWPTTDHPNRQSAVQTNERLFVTASATSHRSSAAGQAQRTQLWITQTSTGHAGATPSKQTNTLDDVMGVSHIDALYWMCALQKQQDLHTHRSQLCQQHGMPSDPPAAPRSSSLVLDLASAGTTTAIYHMPLHRNVAGRRQRAESI